MAVESMPSRDALQRLLDGLQSLIREHLALARAEAKEDLRGLVRDLALSAAGVPALLAGWLLLMVAIAFALSGAMPQWAAFGVVALFNLLVGTLLTLVWGAKVARSRVDLRQTGEELQKDKAWLAQLKQGTAPGRTNGDELSRPLVQSEAR